MKINIFGPKELVNKLFNNPIEDTPEQLFDKAKALFKDGNSGDGYVYLQAAAIKGHPEAAFQMATAISEQKTFGSMEDAVKYYTIASDNNHPQATSNLAICYQLGQGTEVDYVKALHLLNKAIKLGDEMAAFNLAQTYFFGVGVVQDDARGWMMLEVLADKGNAQAQTFMEDLLRKGYKIPDYNLQNLSSQSNNNGVDIIEQYTEGHKPDYKVRNYNVLDLCEVGSNFLNAIKKFNFELFDNVMPLLESLPNVKIRDGYELDAFLFGDRHGTSFCLYACQCNSSHKYVCNLSNERVNRKEIRKWDGKVDILDYSVSKPKPSYSDDLYLSGLYPWELTEFIPSIFNYLSIPFDAIGILEAFLLHEARWIMPTTWHNSYGDRKYIFKFDDLKNLSVDCSRYADDVSILPNVKFLSEDKARLTIHYWNWNRGLCRQTISVGPKWDNWEEEIDTIIPYESEIRF